MTSTLNVTNVTAIRPVDSNVDIGSSTSQALGAIGNTSSRVYVGPVTEPPRMTLWKGTAVVPRSQVLFARMLTYDPLPSRSVLAWLFVRLMPNAAGG